jgi:outer membrane protein OmpA-like peptidoglycan-associated protein
MMAALASPVAAQQQVIPLYNSEKESKNMVLSVDNVKLTATGNDRLGFSMSFALLGNALPREHRVYITPQLVAEGHTVSFPAVEILGSWAYYHDLRTLQTHQPDTLQYHEREAGSYQVYHQTVAREPWMQQATLRLLVQRTDGCGAELKHMVHTLRVPTAIVQQSKVNTREVVVRTVGVQQLRGRAYLSFAVKATDLQPDFRNNRQELARLKSTIDSVINDPNIEILSIQIKGYASPEGKYETNARLARERTNSLTRYIIENTNVEPHLVHTASEPEDWDGLRNFVDSTSMLPHRSELLKMIDSDLYPDEKLLKMATRYPKDFKVISQEAFPLLRHTDYQIDYVQKNVTRSLGKVHTDTIYRLHADTLATGWQTETPEPYRTFRPLLAVKTNLLYDLVLAPNIEVEVPFGRDKRWSVMAEYTNPWWRWKNLDFSYEIQEGGLEVRRWLLPRCNEARPWLSGLFAGVYGAIAKYDIENDGTGDQGDVWSVGATCGYSLPIGRYWNLELSGSVGFVSGERRHYNAEFESTHLIYKYTKNLSYAGPTKLKVSLVWIIPAKKKKNI